MDSDSGDKMLVMRRAQAWQAKPAPEVSGAEAKRRQRLRSLAIAWALAAIALMFFLVTIVRLGAHVANRGL